MPAAHRNLHVPLPDELYDRLREVAKKTKRPATTVARQGIADWIKQKEKELIAEEIVSWAAQHAGSELDFDEDLEKAAVEHLVQKDKSK